MAASHQWRFAVVLAAGSVLLARHPVTAVGTAWQAGQGDVRITCPMTIGGSFEARTNALRGTLAVATSRPATLSGEVTVDLTTLDTGINLRNTHLRTKYLEVGKGADFSKAVLTDITLGTDDAETFQGRTAFTGTLLLHGTRKAIAGQTDIRRQGSTIRVDASFPVILTDYGVPKPQYLGVGVKNQIQVRVSFVATPGEPPITEAR